MVDRIRVYACWRIGHPMVSPPKLKGSTDLCMECSNAIWVADKTRRVIAEYGPGKIVCNVCLTTKFKGVPAEPLVDTPLQRKIIEEMRDESD